MIDNIQLGAVVAPIVSAVVVTILYHYLGKEYLGADENELWNKLRCGVLAPLDSTVRKKTSFALTNRSHEEEWVGEFNLTSQELAVELGKAGYLQGVLSGLKTRKISGLTDYEAGSMVLRESKSDLIPDVLALYQTHIFWFENEDGTLDVFAHYEYSSLNPLVAWKHYRAVGQDYAEGVKRAEKVLQ